VVVQSQSGGKKLRDRARGVDPLLERTLELQKRLSGKAALLGSGPRRNRQVKGTAMAKDHGSSIKNDEQYEGLRKKGMSKQRAASIANSSESSKKGGEKSGKGSGGRKSGGSG
jgi:hypothetical protein